MYRATRFGLLETDRSSNTQYNEITRAASGRASRRPSIGCMPYYAP